MADTGIHVEGLRETVRSLEKLGVEVDDLKDVMAPIATKAADTMQTFVPVRSTALRASVRPNRAKNKAVVTVGSARVRYAGAINYGWRARNIKPADFTGKTDRAMDDTAVRMLEDGIDEILRKEGLA